MENLVKLTIDGVSVEVPAGTTVLEAAKKAGINIPTLCYLKDINQIGACRMCIVDTGARAFGAACVLPVANGMNVKTNTPKLREARRVNLELLLSNHDKKCLDCARNQKCELQQMCQDLGVDDVDKYKGKINEYDIDDLSPSIVRNNNKCILCRRCVAACNKTQAVGVIGPMGRGFKTKIGSAWEQPLNDVACINCGQCIAACPTGALYEKDSTSFSGWSHAERIWVLKPRPMGPITPTAWVLLQAATQRRHRMHLLLSRTMEGLRSSMSYWFILPLYLSTSSTPRSLHICCSSHFWLRGHSRHFLSWLESSSSRFTRRASRSLGVFVFTFIPGATGSTQAAPKARAPVSTTHMRQAPIWLISFR